MKPGDLCYLVRCGVNSGHVVTLLECHPEYANYRGHKGCWKVESSVPLYGWRNGEFGIMAKVMMVPNAWLRPIGGPSTSTDIREEKELEYGR